MTFKGYVEVKSTDRVSNWTLTEVTGRTAAGKDRPSSLAEESLLTDRADANARFRIVARRSVKAAVAALLEAVDRRDPAGPIATLASKIHAKHRATVSAMGHDLDYWTRNTLWDVLPGVDYVELKNLRRSASWRKPTAPILPTPILRKSIATFWAWSTLRPSPPAKSPRRR